ncbi:MAG TPA: mechanosensitive ion channel family protein [Candidatus Paceibacterota bacterium]
MMEFLSKIGYSQAEFTKAFWSFIPNVIYAGIAILFTIIFYKVTARLIEAGLKRTAMQPSLIRITVRSIYKWTVMMVSVIFILGLLGIDVTAALAGVGIISIAIGFAAKEALANVMSGFGIFVDKLYKHGDWVKIEDQYGEVVDITLRTTKIRTLDNLTVTVPNALVTSAPIINYSEEGAIRITVSARIPYSVSIDKARTVLIAAAKEVKGVCAKPEPIVAVESLGDNGIELMVRAWIKEPAREPALRFALTEAARNALLKAKITIPIPQQEVHVAGKGSKSRSTAGAT